MTVAIALSILTVMLLIAGTIFWTRLGYRVGDNVVVRCREGHLFRTIWVPGGSFKALRLGWIRIQHCPAGNHWTIVTPVKDSELTDEERRIAAEHHDIRIP